MLRGIINTMTSISNHCVTHILPLWIFVYLSSSQNRAHRVVMNRSIIQPNQIDSICIVIDSNGLYHTPGCIEIDMLLKFSMALDAHCHYIYILFILPLFIFESMCHNLPFHLAPLCNSITCR